MDEYIPKVGDQVVFTPDISFVREPRWYPPAGTVGTIVSVGNGTSRVQWPAYSTSDNGCWYAPNCYLEQYHKYLPPYKIILNWIFKHVCAAHKS